MKKVLFLSILALLACKKTIEIVEVPVEKKTAWAEVPGFAGTNRILLGSGRSDAALYFQQPYFFTEYKNGKITSYAVGLPTDIDVRLPIFSRFTATPLTDTVFRVLSNTNPIASPSGGYFNIKQLDPAAISIQKQTFSPLFKAMAINSNGVLLFSYTTDQPFFNLMLMKMKTSAEYPYIDTVYTKKIALEKTAVSPYIRQITAVNEHFFVEMPGQGVYKIKEDGAVKKTELSGTIDAFYAWQGKIYGHAEWNTVYISGDEGDNWQSFGGIPDFMTTSRFYVVNDSLVGVNQDNLYTLKWKNSTFTTRFLKNDGLENAQINGIEVLNDSVYVATTAGLFVQAVAAFFEGK